MLQDIWDRKESIYESTKEFEREKTIVDAAGVKISSRDLIIRFNARVQFVWKKKKWKIRGDVL